MDPLFGRLHTAWQQKVFKALFLFARRRFSQTQWRIVSLKGLFSLKHLFHEHFLLQFDSKKTRCLVICVVLKLVEGAKSVCGLFLIFQISRTNERKFADAVV